MATNHRMPTRERRLKLLAKKTEQELEDLAWTGPKAQAKRRRTRQRIEGERLVASSLMRLDLIADECVRIAAFQRHVSKAALLSDIITLWVWVCCDRTQAIYQDRLPSRAQPFEVPDRWPGYLASLGFNLSPHRQEPIAPPEPAIVHPNPPPAAAQPERNGEAPEQPAPIDVPRSEKQSTKAVVDSAPPTSPSAEGGISAGLPPPETQVGSPFQAPLHRMARGQDPPPAPLPEPRGEARIRGFEPEPDEDRLRQPPPKPRDFPLPMSARVLPPDDPQPPDELAPFRTPPQNQDPI